MRTILSAVGSRRARSPSQRCCLSRNSSSRRFESFPYDVDLAQLADGLGTTLGGAYVARAHYIDRQHFTNLSQAVADVIAYANATTAANSDSAKYFFANATIDGKTPASAEAMAILKKIGGSPDMFGRAYGFPAGGSAPMLMAIHAHSRRSRTLRGLLASIISIVPQTTSFTTAGR